MGLDISPEAINTARYYARRESVYCRCSFFVCPPDPPDLGGLGTFDFIVLKDIIEHIQNDKDFLSAIVMHLKLGGNMLVTTPNYLSFGHFLDILYNRWWNGDKAYVGGADHTHVRLYNAFELKKIMESFGMERQKLYGVGIFPWNLILFLTRFRVKSFYPAIIDKMIGDKAPFNALGAGQLNLFRKVQ